MSHDSGLFGVAVLASMIVCAPGAANAGCDCKGCYMEKGLCVRDETPADKHYDELLKNIARGGEASAPLVPEVNPPPEKPPVASTPAGPSPAAQLSSRLHSLCPAGQSLSPTGRCVGGYRVGDVGTGYGGQVYGVNRYGGQVYGVTR